MVPGTHGGGNIESTLTGADNASNYLLVGDTGQALPKKAEPPPVLISLEHVAQMRERRRQLLELQQWAEQKEHSK
jgi:hypothetical protein